MGVEMLDGTIEPAESARTKGKFGMFSTLRFRDRNGRDRTLSKICTGGEVTTLVRKAGPAASIFRMAAGRPAFTE
jgi:hypothetical protein